MVSADFAYLNFHLRRLSALSVKPHILSACQHFIDLEHK